MKRAVAYFAIALASSAGCATDEASDGDLDVPVANSKADGQTGIDIAAGHYRTLRFTTTDKPVDITVWCGIDANPDVVGTLFKVSSTDLGITSDNAQVVDGYWQWSGELAAGEHRIRVTGVDGAGSCNVAVTSFENTCTSSTSFHSPETGHTHLYVGTEVDSWGAFPASGNHWGAWAKWDTTYTEPVLRGWLLHNLEHGGTVLSYGCSSPDESTECAEAAANLQALENASGETRVIITPDPEQGSLYGVRSWRFGMQSDCYNETALKSFFGATIRHGREDIDANPPVPFDPTTTNVDCHDLMAAPDSCN